MLNSLRPLFARPIKFAVFLTAGIGLLSALLQLGATYFGARQEAGQQLQGSAAMILPVAQRALFELNTDVAQNAVDSLVRNGRVRHAMIRDDQGRMFARSDQPTPVRSAIEGWAADRLFGHIAPIRIRLVDSVGGQPLGSLAVDPDPLAYYRHFSAAAFTVAWIEFARVAVLSLALAFLFLWYVARPFRLLGEAIKRADPANPQQTLDLLRQSRVTSEVGQLGQTIERFLLGAQDHVLQRNQALGRVGELEALQQSLAESESRYRSLIAALSEGVVMQSVDGRLLACNQAARQILGLALVKPGDRLDLDTLWQAWREDGSPFPPADLPSLETLQTGSPRRDVRMRVQRADGASAWLSVNSQPVFGGDFTRPEAVVTSFSDITARMKAEQQVIAEKEAALRYLNTAGVMMLLISRDCRVRLANQRTAAVLDVPAESLIGACFDDWIASDDDRKAFQRYRSDLFANETAGPATLVVNMRTTRGEMREVSWNSVQVPDLITGEPLMLCSGEDNTDEHRLRSSLELRTELLEGLAAGMDLPRLASWLTGAFEVCFPSLRAVILLREPLRLLGCHQRALADFWGDWIAHLEFGGFDWPATDMILPAAGQSSLWAQLGQIHAAAGIDGVWARPLALAGKPALACWMVHFDAMQPPAEGDLANIEVFLHVALLGFERAEHERQLIQAKDDALASSRAKSDFLANMSHEIRTPLNAVMGFSSLLQQSRLDKLQREYVSSIITSGEALLSLINDLLDYSKIEAGHLELEHLELEVRVIFDEVLDLFAEKADARGLYLTAVVDATVPGVCVGDPGRLRQVLINLVGNAIKFTSEGGVEIRLSVSEQTARSVSLHCQVIDSGIGMDFAARSKLFQPFSQADASTTRRFGGTGLGLSICRRLIEAMNGEIGVDSSPGFGSTFWFDICLAAPKNGFAEPIVPGFLQETALLAVSDTPAVLAALRSMLGQAVTVASPEQAAAALAEPFDILLLDVQDPVLAASLRDSLPPGRRGICWLGYAEHRDTGSLIGGRWHPMLRPVRRRVLLDTLAELRSGEGSGAGPVPARADVGLAGARILLAEDNPLNQRVASLMLQQLGCLVTVASNGLQAIELLQQQPFDLVLMDCQMPVMDGYQATRAIRELDVPCSGIPVVALTANAFQEDRDACLAAGMDDFATKPISVESLTAILQRWLPAQPKGAVGPAGDPLPEAADHAAALAGQVDQALAELAGQLGKDVVVDVVALALAIADEIGPQLASLLQSRQADALARQAHKLKGAVAQIGAAPLAAQLKALELAARAEDWTAAGEAAEQALLGLRQMTTHLATRRA